MKCNARVLEWLACLIVLALTTASAGTTGSEAFEEFAAGKGNGSEIAVVVDAFDGNGARVKEFWRAVSGNGSGRVWFGVVNGKGYETRVSHQDLQESARRVESLQVSAQRNGTSDDLYRQILRTMSIVPPRTDVFVFTGRRTEAGPLQRACMDKVREKELRVFVMWTRDGTEGSEPLQAVVEASNGTLDAVVDLLDEVSARRKEEGSTTYTQTTFSQIVEPDGSDVEVQFDGENTDKTLRRLERVRFPNEPTETDASVDQMSLNASMERQQSKAFYFIPVRVEVSSSSRLEFTPGTSHVIQFEVRNNLNVPMRVIHAAGLSEGVRVTNIQPRTSLLRPLESAKVDVYFDSLPSVPDGGEAILTFSSGPDGGAMTYRKAIIRFTNKETSDTWDPKVSYTYKGDCRGHDKPDTCETGDWTFEATFVDETSGLKKVVTEPFGATFKTEFIAGTKSPVTIFYTLSCCQPKVDIWAEDSQGNYVRRSLDVYNQGLQTGEIAAIVLGVLLLICVIIGIIAAVVIARKRKQNKFVIERYQGTS